MTPLQAGAAVVAMLSTYQEAFDADRDATDVQAMVELLDHDEARLCLGVLLGITTSIIGVLASVTGNVGALITITEEAMAVLREEAANDG